MNFTGGTPVTADISGVYTLTVPYNWSGTVTPSLAGYAFTPVSRTYSNLTSSAPAQNYSAIVSSIVYYVDKTSSLGTCSDTLNDGRTPTHPFCTISRASDLASPGNTINVMAGSYAEKVRPLNNGTAGNPITYSAGTGVTVTGSHDGLGSDSAFRFTTKSYIVVQGFIVADTVDEGIYVSGGDHISILNNSVTSAGSPSGVLDRPGIYLYNTTNSTVSGNTTYLNSSHGIDIEGASSNIVVSNNTSYGNAYEVGRIANGIMIQGTSTNITVVHNTLYNNEDTGIGLNGTSHDNFIVGNLSYGNGDHGIDVSGSKSNRIVGNTISGNVTVGINLEGTDDAHNASGSTVQNNISVNNGITPPTGLPGNIRVDTLSLTGTTVDYNLVYQSGGSTYVQYVWGTTQYFALTTFQAASGQETHGYQANPLLVAPAAPASRPVSGGHPTIATGDYHITSASPVIDSANSDAPGETTQDIEGTARLDIDTTTNTGAGTRAYDDRGAYEYHKLSQTISFTSTAPTDATVGVGSYTPTATATSSLPVTFTIDSSAASFCSISSGVVSFTGIGTCVINANQAGNANYSPAPQVQQSFAVKSNQTISFTSIAPTTAAVGGPTYTPTATSTSGLTVVLTVDPASSSVCTLTTGIVSFNDVGTCTINANQPGNGSYNAAVQVQQSFGVKRNQTISFTSTAPIDATVGGATYTPTATATSGQAVVFTIDGSATSFCSISSGVVSFTGIGTCVINANQSGNASYYAAPQVQQSFSVRATTTTSVVSDKAAPVFAESVKFTATVTAGATGNVSFYNGASLIGTAALNGSTPNEAVLNYAGLDVAGSPHSITAQYVGDTHYFGSTSPALSQVVNPKPITITPNNGQSKVFGTVADPTFTYVPTPALEAGGSFTGALGRDTGDNVGDYNFTLATLSAGANYTLSLAAGHHFSITPKSVTIIPDVGQTKVFGAANPPVYTYSSTGLLGLDEVTGAMGRDTGEIVGNYGFTLGTLTAGSNYTLAFTASPATFSISPKPVTITPTAGQTKVFGTADPLPFGYTHSALVGTDAISGSLSRLAGENVANYAFDVSTLTAGSNYQMVLAVGAPTFSITPKSITITPTVGQTKVYGTPDPVFTYAHTAMVGLDAISGLLGRDPGANVGNYAYTLGSLDAGINYTLVMTLTPSTFSITKAAQVINFTSTAPTGAVVDGSTYHATATGGASGNPVVITIDPSSSAVCSISSGIVSFHTVGTCIVNANQVGSANYFDAVQEQQSFAVGKGAQVIAFTSTVPSNAIIGGSYTPAATGGASGNPVVFTIDAASTSVCSINAGLVTFNHDGDCVIDANQAGDANYNAAPQQQQIVGVGKMSQTIVFSSTAPAAAVVDGPSYTPTATGGGSGNPVVFSIDASASSVCTLSAGHVSFIAVGTCTIDANQAGSDDYSPAAQVQQSFSVGMGSQVITFTSTAPGDANVLGPTYTPAATGGASGNPVQFTIDAASSLVCEINAGVVSFTGIGTCTINANQSGSVNYNAAAQVQQSFGVVAHINRAPSFTVPGPVSVTMSVNGSPTPFDLTLHASDLDGDTITWDISVAAAHGNAAVTGTGTSKIITYTPNHNYAGTDSFTVHITDGNGGNATIIVNVNITSIGATYHIYLPMIGR
jgi:parallel beta-helix repeat protein